mmetsp:Transcript_47840/g.113984  ORF Transcript_47840/g.113984 Transcript_47840/m.113984 type:complete len:226 (-) Transcript_47840:627-1304(-)
MLLATRHRGLETRCRTDSGASSLQGLGQVEFHNTTDGHQAILLLVQLFEAHAQVELQKLFLCLQHLLGVDHRWHLEPKVVRDQRVVLRGKVHQGLVPLLGKGRVHLLKHRLALLDLLLRKLPQGRRVPTTAVLILRLDHGVFAHHRLPIMRVDVIVMHPGLVFELRLEDVFCICLAAAVGEIVLPSGAHAAPAREGVELAAVVFQKLNPVVLVVVVIHIRLVQQD